jgi:hypothetical protein
MTIDEFTSKCAICQANKAPGVGSGELPPPDAVWLPLNEVAVNLIGPWKVTIREQELLFSALTCINPVSNLVELIWLDNKMAENAV